MRRTLRCGAVTKTLKQPEANPDLYHFIEDAFLHLDEAKGQAIANFLYSSRAPRNH